MSRKQEISSTATRPSTSTAALRLERDAAAVRWLRRTGNDDVIPMLGLEDVARQPGRCGYCGKTLALWSGTLIPTHRRRGYCSPTCDNTARLPNKKKSVLGR